MIAILPQAAVVESLFLRGFDLLGTFVFAMSGAVSGEEHGLDLYGILVLAFVAGNFGGITRDVLIGAVPPAAIQNPEYLAVSLVAGIVAFYGASRLARFKNAVLILDAAGLGLFAVTGATKALAFHLGPVPAALLGMLTGIGGGIVRDLLVSEIPTVFRADIYAFAALAGAAVCVSSEPLHISSTWTGVTGAVLCFGIRMAAIRYHWQLPKRANPSSTPSGGAG